MKVVEVRSVCKSLGKRLVLKGVSLSVERGERVAVLGPSGCGKTTLLRLLAGLETPDSGQILMDARVVAADGRLLVESEERPVAMVFQDLALWPHMTVAENLRFGLAARGTPREDRERLVRECLEVVRLSDRGEAHPAELSGGEQQRVALARVLVLRPEVILMDEPLSSHDDELKEHLIQEILDLWQRWGFALIYVTHDRHEARVLGTRTISIRDGVVADTAE